VDAQIDIVDDFSWLGFYCFVANGLVSNTYEPPIRWLRPAHAEQPTILQKPGHSSFLLDHNV